MSQPTYTLAEAEEAKRQLVRVIEFGLGDIYRAIEACESASND